MRNNRLIILSALKSELKFILENLSNVKKEDSFHFGTFEGINVIAAKSGLGKVRSAAFTQYCIDKFNDLELIVNFGCCGQINENFLLGDTVFCEKTVEYDFISLRNFVPFFEIECEFEKKFLKDFGFKTGILLTGTQNIDSKDKKIFLKEKFNGSIGDWEGSAIAQISLLNKKRVMIFKCVTDRGDENLLKDFKENFETAMKQSSYLVLKFLSFLNRKGCLFQTIHNR